MTWILVFIVAFAVIVPGMVLVVMLMKRMFRMWDVGFQCLKPCNADDPLSIERAEQAFVNLRAELRKLPRANANHSIEQRVKEEV